MLAESMTVLKGWLEPEDSCSEINSIEFASMYF